ncbi:MAG: CvpA family protein [Clostridiales bacterium]|nr:CvpA family protein [Clostridiales bacterium]
MSVIDILFLAIIVVFAVFSYKRGIMSTILEIVAFVLAVAIAVYAAKPVGKIMYNSFIRSSIENHVKNAIQEINFDDKVVSVEEGAQIIYDNMPDFAVKIAKSNGIDERNIVSKVKTTKFNSVAMIDMTLTKVVDPIVLPATETIAFIILSAALIFLLRLFARMLSKDNEEDGFNANKFFGGLFGIAKGIVVVYVVCALLHFINLVGDNPNEGLGEILSKSQVFNFMINNNPVIEGLKEMF